MDLTDFGDNLLKSQTLYDGMGRTVETRQFENATAYVMTKRTYDALGRIDKVSNPYKTGQTLYWTTTAYDALGRASSVTSPDNAIVTTSYSGNTVPETAVRVQFWPYFVNSFAIVRKSFLGVEFQTLRGFEEIPAEGAERR